MQFGKIKFSGLRFSYKCLVLKYPSCISGETEKWKTKAISSAQKAPGKC